MKSKTRKRILTCMLWLCAIACFTGFPWMFFSWDTISHMGICDKPSAVTLVLLRQQCLFFGFFCLYFMFLSKTDQYRDLIKYGTILIAFMGFFMYLLKLQTGIDNVSSNYEPFIWFVIGSMMFYLNYSKDGVHPGKHKTLVLSSVFQIYAGLLCLNIFCLFFPQQSWEIMFKTPFSELSTYDRYTFGMVSGFMTFSSIIIYYVSNRLQSFFTFSKAVLIFSLIYFAAYLFWRNLLKLYTPLFIGYIVFVEILILIGLVYIFKHKTYGK